MARKPGTGARIVYIGRQRLIKKRKENLHRANFVISVPQKRKKGIAKSKKPTWGFLIPRSVFLNGRLLRLPGVIFSGVISPA
jgi:hypothetical protein